MIAVRLPSRLTVQAWERHIGAKGGPFTSHGEWSADSVLLDFSAVEFAHLGALARVLLLLDAAVSDGVRAEVVLPTGRLAPDSEARSDLFGRRTARQARERAEARAFMRHIGFEDALRPAHWPPGAVVVSDAKGVPRDDGPEAVDPGTRHGGVRLHPRRILPFRWLHPTQGIAGRGIQDALQNAVKRMAETGVSGADSRAIVDALVSELVDNVRKHASGSDLPRHALVAGTLVGEGLYASRRAELPGSASTLADSLREGGSRLVLSLIVGDSGVGLARPRLGTSAQEAILTAFDRKPEDPSERRGEANGLWRAARLVRGYGGAIAVTAGGAHAGRSFAAADPVDISESLPLRAPGTLIEVGLLIEGAPHRRTSAAWKAGPSVRPPARLAVLTCALDPASGLSETDRGRLNAAARRANGGTGPIGVVANIPLLRQNTRASDGRLETALERVLDATRHLDHPAPIVVVLPDTDSRILDLAVAGINADEDQAGTPDRTPILVLGSSGSPLWCGGPRWLRAVLDTLTASGGTLARAGLAADAPLAGLADFGHLVTTTATEVALRVSASDAVHALLDHARGALSRAIESGGPGVEVGYFRTPTLRPTSRWITARPLVEATIGSTTAAWLLARLAEAHADLPASSAALAVARVWTAPDEMATQLSECLSLGGRFHTLPDDLDLEGAPISDQVPHHAGVVLCTDMISTENTARRAAAVIAGKAAVPVAVVAVVDSRSERGPIRLFNRDIPVLSLVTADVAGQPTPEHPEPVDIDPLLMEPTTANGQVAGRTPIDEETTLAWCARNTDWLRLGHIERVPRSRHFSAYLRLDRLVSDPGIAASLRDAVRATVTEVVGLWREQGHGFADAQVWHPADPYAGTLAQLVRDAVADDLTGPVRTRPVPRAVAGTRWTFPVNLEVRPPPGMVILVDWGALTSTSIHQMMRLATESGAAAILAVVLLNQLDDQDADALRAISAMQATRTSPLGHGVPAQVRFLASTGLGTITVRSCTLCEVAGRADEYATSAPSALRAHSVQLREQTRLRNREEAFGSPPVDVFTVPVTGDDLADYMRWRGLLLRAMRLTSARQEVVDKLAHLAATDMTGVPPPRWTRTNLIRLVAAEQHWLKLPPLRYSTSRDLLAQICTAMLWQPPTTLPWLRAQVVMVMAASEPPTLIELMPELITRNIDEPVMINQLLLECYRLTRKPRLDSPVDFERMLVSLRRCRNRLESMLGDRDSATIRTYVGVLRQLVMALHTGNRPGPRDAQDAWDRLREDYRRSVEQHGMQATLLRVRDFVEDLQVAPPEPERIREALTDWDQCATLLSEQLLANLPALTEILAGDYVSDRVGREEQRRLLSLAEGHGVGELQAVLDNLHELGERPWDREDPQWQRGRSTLLEQLKWWYRVLMDPHAQGKAPAMFVDLISSIPTVPGVRVDKVLRGRARHRLAELDVRAGMTHKVFCPTPLLDSVLAQILDNLDHHATGDAPQKLEVEYRVADGVLALVVRNSGTRPHLPEGQGLRALDEKLRPFGGSLTGHPAVDGGWTFTTTAYLPLWRGA